MVGVTDDVGFGVWVFDGVGVLLAFSSVGISEVLVCIGWLVIGIWVATTDGVIVFGIELGLL